MASGYLSRILGLTAVRDASSPEQTMNVNASGHASVRTPGYNASVAFTRTTDTNAYLAMDIVGTNAAGSPGPAALTFANIGNSDLDHIVIGGTTLRINLSSVPSGMTNFFLALYNVTPPSALNDNDPFDIPSGDRSAFLGILNLGTVIDYGSTLWVEQNGIYKQVKPLSTSLFGYLITATAYTPASGTGFDVGLQSASM